VVKKFIGSITKTEHHCVLEATGNYGTLLLEETEISMVMCRIKSGGIVTPLRLIYTYGNNNPIRFIDPVE